MTEPVVSFQTGGVVMQKDGGIGSNMDKTKDMFPLFLSPTELIFSPSGKYDVSFSEDCPLEILFHAYSFDYILTPSYHDFFEIIYIYNGGGSVYVENKKYEANDGDIFIIGNSEFHRLEAINNGSFKSIDLYFLPKFVYSIGQNSYDFGYLRPFFDHSSEFTNRIPAEDFCSDTVLDLVRKIYLEKQEKNDFFQLAVKNYLTEILLLIVRYFRKFSSDLFIYSKKHHDIERLKNVFSYLKKNYCEKIALDSMAHLACMSTSYFCKFFKKVTGYTLTDYVFSLRIDRAKELLLRGDMNIIEIAYETGFTNHSYFDRIFRRLTKLSPNEYRFKVIGE
jgi:AraC-like DNA-binding protein/mannose-6-phosphate isomerase-like protein (cupin superfamily)